MLGNQRGLHRGGGVLESGRMKILKATRPPKELMDAAIDHVASKICL